MPGTGKYGTVYDKLARKRPDLEKLFKSPMYPGDTAPYTLDKLIETARATLIPPHQVGDLGVFPAGVDLNFANAPDLTDASTGGGGLPSTPYTPNQMSPGADPASNTGDIGSSLDGVPVNVDPTKQGDPGLTPTDIDRNFVPGVDSTVNPATTSPVIGSNLSLGTDLPLGQSSKTRWPGDPQPA